MSKIFLVVLLAVTINLGTIKKSEAVLAGIVSLAGGASAGALAYAGLSSIIIGYTIPALNGFESGDDDVVFFMAAFLAGIIFLEEDGSAELQLPTLSKTELTKNGLTPSEVNSVLENKEELEAVFNDSMALDQTVEEASARWEIARDIYGSDAVSGFYKTLKQESN